MSFVLGRKSLERLVGVDPRLADVVKKAIALSTVDFTVIEGVRSQARQDALYAQGRTTAGKIITWTRKSRHTPRPPSNLGEAVDLAPWVNGRIEWDDWKKFEAIARAMKQAARDLGVAISWGGDWTTRKDGPHFELA